MNWLGRLFGGVDDAPSVPQWCPGYMGNVGERLELQLTLVDRLMVDRPSTYLTGEKGCRLRFRDAEGHCILLWTNEGGRGTDLKIEEPILARMTVQEHTLWNGVHETVISSLFFPKPKSNVTLIRANSKAMRELVKSPEYQRARS